MSRPERLVVSVIADGPAVEAYRIVRGANLADPALADAFRSNYEQGKPPRGVESRLAVVQMGISMYMRPAQAEKTARRWPKIGNHIAEMSLTSGEGFAYAPTGPPGHITVWGRPLQLRAAIVDIYPVNP
jgi:hypothetical protein